MKKAIYTNFTSYFFHTAMKLREIEAFEPCFWLVNEKIVNDVEKSFPDCITYDFYQAIKGFLPLKCDLKLDGLLDAQVLDYHSQTESICLNMMNRNDITLSYSYYERVKMFKHYLKTSIAILNQFNPDIVFFTEEPHQPFLYVLYREVVRRNIPTQMFIRTSFMQRIVPVFRFEDGCEVLVKQNQFASKRAELTELPEDIQKNIIRIKGDYKNGMPSYMKWQHDAFSGKSTKKRKGIIKKVMKNVNLFNLVKKYNRLNENRLSDQCHPTKGFYQTTNTHLEMDRWIEQTTIRNKELLSYYKSICNPSPDLNASFVFFTLHYQPEKTTSPVGGQFVDQLLAIELISKALPNGWKLYVKEHISQFVLTQFGNQTRSELYYQHIKNLPNTELLPLDFQSFDLIDKCKATAGISGTVIFEGIVRGKPGMHFGAAWYRGCYGIDYVQNESDIIGFFNKIKSFQFDEGLLFAYLKRFGELTYRGVIGNKQTANEGITHEENGELHFKAIANELKLYYEQA